MAAPPAPSAQVNTSAPHGPQGPTASRLDGFVAGVPLTVIRTGITVAALLARGVVVAPTDTLVGGQFVIRPAAWSADLIAVEACAADASAAPWAVSTTVDAAASLLCATPCAYALYLHFTLAGAVTWEAGTIAGRATAAEVTT